MDEFNKKVQPLSSSDFNKTFYKNELKNVPQTFCFKAREEKRLPTDYVEVKKCDSVSRSKNSRSSLKTEESLGILSHLLDEEESWNNILDQSTINTIGNNPLIQKSNDKIDVSVFYPPEKTSVLGSKPNFNAEQVDSLSENCLISKCTSTPKRCFGAVIDLSRTVNRNDKQSFDFIHDEPIVAGSSKLNFEMNLDLTKFEVSDICPPLKPLPSLPIRNSASNEISCIKNGSLVKSNRNDKYQEVTNMFKDSTISTIPNVCESKKQFPNIHNKCIVDDSDILNSTFIINSDSLSNPAASTSFIVKDFSPHVIPESDSFYSDRKLNGAMQMNSTFITHNFDEKVSEVEKTFIIESSPVKIPKVLFSDCETIPMKNMLSTIFEKASGDYVSVNRAVESKDDPSNITRTESPTSSKFSSEDMDHVIGSSSSLSKTASELNSTFCISSGENKNKRNTTTYLDVKKRYSLSSINVKNSVCIKKEKSVITSLKENGQKSISQSRLSVITKKKSKQISSSSSSTSSIKQSKDKISKDKNATEVSSAKNFLEIAPKRKLKKTCSVIVKSSFDTDCTRNKLRKSLGSCKSVDSLGIKENAPNLVLKGTETNSKVLEKCKSISFLPTKAIPKMLFNYKEITSEYSNLNHKVNALTGSCEFNSRNPVDLKIGNFKHRRSMLPTVLANSTSTKNSICKDRNDVKCIINAVKTSFTFTEKSFPSSKIHQDGLASKRSTERKNTEKMVSKEAFEKNSNTIENVKTNKNVTIHKSKLLKPGTISRLPLPEKLSKPDCVLNIDESNAQSQHILKRVEKNDNQRTYRRIPFQKLQEKH